MYYSLCIIILKYWTLWFNFNLGLNFICLSLFLGVIMYDNQIETNKKKLKPWTKILFKPKQKINSVSQWIWQSNRMFFLRELCNIECHVQILIVSLCKASCNFQFEFARRASCQVLAFISPYKLRWDKLRFKKQNDIAQYLADYQQTATN